MEEETETLYLELQKLPATISEQELDQSLTTLWKTRRTGLRSPQKSHFLTLFNLPSLSQLHPVLACLRSLIRKCVHQNLTGSDLLKLFPPDLSLELQSMLVLLLQKYQSQWKEEVSREKKHASPRTSVSHQVKTGMPPSLPSEIPAQLWQRQDDSISSFICTNNGVSTPMIAADTTVPSLASMPQQHDTPLGNPEILLLMKSMTWTIESCSSGPANIVAVICLKLQDDSKSPPEETEVKFQLTKDTLEAMIRSMTYISEELSLLGDNPSEQLQKKQKH
ncbi:hypothetical protein ACFE04_028735 [Oxalis oulophora]